MALTAALPAVLVIVGIFTTPRYNYSALEEMELFSVNQTYEIKARKLDTARSARGYEFAMKGASEAAWMDANLFPLYDEWINALKQLHFNPSLLTAKWQTVLIDTQQKRLQNWRVLRDALASGKSKTDARAIHILKAHEIMDARDQQLSHLYKAVNNRYVWI